MGRVESDQGDRVRKRATIFGVSLSVVLMIVAALVGLAIVAFFILMSFWRSAWGSNK